MDSFLTEQQIEELVNFDHVESDLSDLIEEQNDFNMNEYLNSNYDYWLTMSVPTSTVNVLPYMMELRDTWRRQNFTFTKEQQEEYDILLAARRERVRYFYDNDLVSKGGLRKREVEVQEEEDWHQGDDQETGCPLLTFVASKYTIGTVETADENLRTIYHWSLW